ncbi:hypothetical protein SDC9_58370 [bioreactor metagenome]|uniref:Transmembrane protein n=1 Tax=bioreactor metagenome TaxID=1076179 RepID=A0A644X7G6_9ZZZZ
MPSKLPRRSAPLYSASPCLKACCLTFEPLPSARLVVSVPFFVSPFKLFLLMSLLYALPQLVYSRALARLFVPGLDTCIRSASLLRSVSLFSGERTLYLSCAIIPHSFLLLLSAGAQKKQATFHRRGCCLLFALIFTCSC